MSAVVEIDGVGPVVFKRRRARNLNISIRPRRPVHVSVPFGISFDRAQEMVRSKISWMQKHSQRMKRLEEEHKSRLKGFNAIDKVEARGKLIERLQELSESYKIEYNRVFIRNQRTLWGSCSARNDISLNIKLAHLPGKLIDYIILHELLHTRFKGHGRDFWAELDRLVGDAKALNAEVKSYHLGLME